MWSPWLLRAVVEFVTSPPKCLSIDKHQKAESSWLQIRLRIKLAYCTSQVGCTCRTRRPESNRMREGLGVNKSTFICHDNDNWRKAKEDSVSRHSAKTDTWKPLYKLGHYDDTRESAQDECDVWGSQSTGKAPAQGLEASGWVWRVSNERHQPADLTERGEPETDVRMKLHFTPTWRRRGSAVVRLLTESSWWHSHQRTKRTGKWKTKEQRQMHACKWVSKLVSIPMSSIANAADNPGQCMWSCELNVN